MIWPDRYKARILAHFNHTATNPASIRLANETIRKDAGIALNNEKNMKTFHLSTPADIDRAISHIDTLHTQEPDDDDDDDDDKIDRTDDRIDFLERHGET